MNLIAIEGVDGSGKATQTKLLKKNLEKLGYKIGVIGFPTYGDNSACFVEKYLNGDFGEDVDSYIASSFYTLDRFGQKDKIMGLMKDNDFLISDRYSMSSFIHRGGDIYSKEGFDKLKDYYKWIYDFEFNKAGLPIPNKIIFLSLGIDNIRKLVLEKNKQSRNYIKNGNLDIMEKNIKHQEASLNVGKNILPGYFDNYFIVECEDGDGNILSPEDINQKILDIIL